MVLMKCYASEDAEAGEIGSSVRVTIPHAGYSSFAEFNKHVTFLRDPVDGDLPGTLDPVEEPNNLWIRIRKWFQRRVTLYAC